MPSLVTKHPLIITRVGLAAMRGYTYHDWFGWFFVLLRKLRNCLSFLGRLYLVVLLRVNSMPLICMQPNEIESDWWMSHWEFKTYRMREETGEGLHVARD